MHKVERAHQMYRERRYAEALVYYAEALSIAKTNNHKIALHSNRAACYLKLHDFAKAAEECTSVLELDHKHTGALMLRVQMLVALKEYHAALFDVNQLIELNPCLEVYRNLQSRLKSQLSLDTIEEDEAEFEEDDGVKSENRPGVVREQHCKEVNKIWIRGNHLTDTASTTATPMKNKEKEPETVTPEAMASIQQSSGWKTIPKPKGHSHLDYSRWDQVEDVSSDDDDNNSHYTSHPQYRFRVKP